MGVQQTFAANLRRHRKELGVSQEELGDLADLHRTEISLLERAERDPRLTTIVKLARVLGITPSELIRDIT
ncbi:MAG: helix-turn-helix transcriptional regulator [Solirubrobacterales bacterium]|nr:helix-turn-helix transcriptional regulator [Solirubrobacterales bacterium]OJU96348.1 MAG: hypothetical protein BGO23_01935 [Solirubrobacterales bacterium 67-14]